MDELPKNAKTLEEIEGELMFGELPDNDSEDGNGFDDDYDVANDETFGDVLLGATDAELEDYAAQTARLRLDDPVWENPTSSAPAPDASQIPMPFSLFSGGVDPFSSALQNEKEFLDKSIWSDDTSKPFSSIWGNNFGLGRNDTARDSQLGDISSLLGDDNTQYERKSPMPAVIPAMPSAAITLEDLEKWDEPSPSVLAAEMQSLSISEPSAQPTGLPAFPAAALSLSELEEQLMQTNISKLTFERPVQEEQEPVSPSLSQKKQVPYQPRPIPPLPMGLPKLPPLDVHLLPLVPIWLGYMTNQHPLPPLAPPPPPFLYQLLQVFQNPHLVHQMIFQSSMPPPNMMFPPPPQQLMQPPPQSPMHKQYKKHSGMPSIRTIQDLALDSFAGYMSWKEREWLIKIQILQCKGCGDPMVEDYYYTMWREKQIANGWVPKPKDKIEPSSKESRQDYLERTRRMNYREMQKERASEREKERRKEKEQRGEEKKQKLTLSDKFASSLGLPSKSSTANPRQLIMMNKQTDSSEISKLTDEERKIAVAKKLRTMLLRLEEAITMLLDVDELRTNNIGANSKFYNLSSKERVSAADERIAVIIEELMGDDMQKLLQMAKGRTVINKTLKHASPKEQARIVLSIISAAGLVNKKLFGEIILEILPTIYSKLSTLHQDQLYFLINALNIVSLKKQVFNNNSVVRDILLTLLMITENNNQNFLSWMSATRFPTLAMEENKQLTNWRKALKVLNDEVITDFSNVIEKSGVLGCDELATLIRQSI